MSQIDQSNFEATSVPHVFKDKVTGKYYFCDETSEAHGPYEDLHGANMGMKGYIDQFLGSGEGSIAEQLAAALEGASTDDVNDPLNALLSTLLRSRAVVITEAEMLTKRDDETNRLLEAIHSVFVPSEKRPYPQDAVTWFAGQVLSAHLHKMLAEDEIEPFLKDPKYNVGSYEAAIVVLKELFIGQAFAKDEVKEGMWLMQPAALDHCFKVVESAFKQLQAKPDYDAACPSQQETTQRLARNMTTLVKQLGEKYGRNTPEEIIKFVNRLRRSLTEAMTFEEYNDFIQAGRMQSLDDMNEAIFWVSNIMFADKCIVRDTSVPDGMDQPWSWNEEAEKKVLEQLRFVM